MFTKSYTFKAVCQNSSKPETYFGHLSVSFFSTIPFVWKTIENHLEKMDNMNWSITDLRRIK